MFNHRKTGVPSPLPLAEQQQYTGSDDGDVSVYNSKSNTPTTSTAFEEASVSFTDKEDADSAQSSLKRLHKHSKSTLPYSMADDTSYAQSYTPTASKYNKNHAETYGQSPRGVASFVLLVKQAITDSGNMTFALVIFILIFLIVCTDPSLTTLFGSKTKPIHGLTQEVISIKSPFIIPDLAQFFQENPGSSIGDVPKRAPGDYAKGLAGEKAPHAAMGAGNTNPEKVDKTEKVDSAAKLDSKKKNLGAMVYKSAATTPPLIMVLALNPDKYKIDYLEKLIENRRKYAERYGHGLYVRYVNDFSEEWSESHEKKTSWAKLSIMRAAFHAFPNAKHFWYLDHNAFIANMDISIIDQIIAPPSLQSIMMRDVPILMQGPSVVRTYKNTSPENVKFIITQDYIGLNPSSFIIANFDTDKGEFAKSFLDYWNDPLCRAYKNFDRADASALNHVMQWHPAFLARSAVISTRRMAANSVVPPEGANLKKQLTYVPGDFVSVLTSCTDSSSLTCMKELSTFNSPNI